MESEKLKIPVVCNYVLWVASWYPCKYNPYPGDFIQRHAVAASRSVPIVVLHISENVINRTEIEILENHSNLCEVIVYIRKPILFRKNKFLKLIRHQIGYLTGFYKIRSKFGNPSIIHCHVIYAAAFFCLLAQVIYKSPLIISEHWSGYFEKSGKYKGMFMKWLAKTATSKSYSIITISDALPNAMKKHGLNGNYEIIPNVVDTTVSYSNKLNKEISDFKFIHVSSLDDDSKNISGMLLAVEKLQNERLDFKFEIVGGIPIERKNYFEKIVIDKGLEKFIIFTGPLTHKETISRMQTAHVKVLFSNYEGGLPCVIAESFAIGLPVIVTNLPGLIEWIDEETGMSVNIGDIEGLAAAMSLMIDNYHLYNGLKMRDIMEKHCSYNVINKKFESIYIKALLQISSTNHS